MLLAPFAALWVVAAVSPAASVALDRTLATDPALPAAEIKAEPPPQLLHIDRKTQAVGDLVVELVVARPHSERGGDISGHLDAALSELARVDAAFDERRPGGAIGRINAAAGQGPVAVDPETFAVLTELRRVAHLTRGAFDITSAAYERAWFPSAMQSGRQSSAAESTSPSTSTSTSTSTSLAASPPPERVVPDKSALASLRALVGADVLELDPVGRTARLQREGMRMSVRPVVWGYGLDRAAAVLESRGLRDFVISAGGDVVVRGSKVDTAWNVGIQDPRGEAPFAVLISRANEAVMTASDAEGAFTVAGVRHHAILDPRSGQSAGLCRSVTIVGPDALTADALARAVFVLGAKEGLRLVKRLPGVEALIVTGDNEVVSTPGLKARVKVRTPSVGQ